MPTRSEAGLPLLPAGSAAVAWRDGRAVGRDQFLADVARVAALLPDTAGALNLCADRYWFAVSLLACVARGVVARLPNSAAPDHLATVAAGGGPALVDHDAELPAGLQPLRVDRAAGAGPALPSHVPAGRTVVTVHTSGSTGVPQAHDKTFGAMLSSTASAAAAIWRATGGPCMVVGTAAFRHMFGLESTVLLPLYGGGMLTEAQPFFPADVAAALEAVPGPRLLVTTPFHLRKLVESGIALPPLAGVLSATAPLATELAERVEQRLGAPVLEIYGSTETGQLATRRTVDGPHWTLLDAVELREQGGAWIADGAALPRPQVLADVIETVDARRFKLVDRGAHMINIVGKRSSLGFLNHQLAAVPGVVDGVFCLPDPEADAARLAAFVVAPGMRAGDIVAALRRHIDPVFLPRPLVLIDELPRDANGKVTSATLRRLVAEHVGAGI